MGYPRGPIGQRERFEMGVRSRHETGYAAQSLTGLLKIPIIGFVIAIVLFGPVVLTSFIKFLPGIPFHIWVVGFVLLFVYRWLS